MKASKPNIKDIAKKTGLSITTVSRVLNGKAEQYRISEKSKQKVLKAARQLNYMPNQVAVNLRLGKSHTIALIIPSLTNPFFAGIASAINAELSNLGYITILGDSDEKLETEKDVLQQMVSRRIEGLIIAPCGGEWAHIKRYYDQGLPVICIDRYFDKAGLPYVSTDNYYGAYEATRHLIEHGHSNIACIQGVKQSMPNKQRIKGFIDAMKEAGISSYSITGDAFNVPNGYLETKLLLRKTDPTTAIFTLSNTIAMGCMKALKEEYLNIPDDMSLITFDDHPYLDYLATPLSSVAQPVTNICKIAIKFLFSQLNKSEMVAQDVLLKPEIKYRDSVKRIIKA
jgi:LacI family transcriptional regulator